MEVIYINEHTLSGQKYFNHQRAGALLAEWELMEFVCQQNEQFFSHYIIMP